VDGSVELWNLNPPTRTASWQVATGETKSALFTPDGDFIAANAGETGEIKIWDINTHNMVRSFPPLGRALELLAFTRDSQFLAGAHFGRYSPV